MKLLAIETATEACSAALHLDGVIYERYRFAPREHSQLVLAMMEDLLRSHRLTLSDLDALAFGRGPGSFTGVRIAASVTQGAAFGAGLPVVPVSTLEALAQEAARETGHRQLLCAIDARMGELYWAGYHLRSGAGAPLVVPECVVSAELAELPEAGEWFGVGSGWHTPEAEHLRQRLGGRLIGTLWDRYPRARAVAAVAATALAEGKQVPASEALPVYLRDQVASKPA